MPNTPTISSPDDANLNRLCDALARRANALDISGGWPSEQLRLCADYGVYQWFLSKSCGGQGWNTLEIIKGYLRLSAACLTTTFIITQRTGACRRIEGSHNDVVKEELLPGLVSGEHFATVGISHLTTSRRHLAKPVLAAREVAGGYVLDGFSPWVTGGLYAQTIVIGATLDDGRQILLALPTDLPGVKADEPPNLVGLSASQTGPVRCRDVFVDRRWLLAGPVENIMKQGIGATPGGLQTSTLAIGLTDAALKFLESESEQRSDLSKPTESMRQEHGEMKRGLLALAAGETAVSLQEFRAQANSLVLRSTQAALAAAKGSGYVEGHPAGRWCREALFFLVWSCPQQVMAANLCELAGIAD